MSHIIETTLEQKDACHRSLDESAKRISAFRDECKSRASEQEWLVDEAVRATLDRIVSECNQALENLKSLDQRIELTRTYTDLQMIYREAQANNSVLLRAGSFAEAMLDSFHKHYLDPNDSFERIIETVSESEVKVLARILHNNPRYADMPAAEIIALADSKVHPEKVVEVKHTDSLRKELRRQMSAEKVDDDTAQSVLGGGDPRSPLEMFNAVQTVITDERRRRAAINAIVKSISKRGFIVRKENIRHIRETDSVKFVASKPGGQKAEFTIDLSGRFSYKFEGYEGLACEKDISPLEKDLEEVYGFKMGDRNVVWSNPDKTMKYHHAAMNVRRDS